MRFTIMTSAFLISDTLYRTSHIEWPHFLPVLLGLIAGVLLVMDVMELDSKTKVKP